MNIPVKRIDLVADSLDHLLTAIFIKSSSPQYPLAVALARKADKYEEGKVGKREIHMVAYKRGKVSAAKAFSLIKYIYKWRGTQIFVIGKPVHGFRVQSILECYMTALNCKNPDAHCKVPLPSSMRTKVDELLAKDEVRKKMFPCSFLFVRFRYQPDHSATYEEQIQAAGVKYGCAMCPLFDI